MLNNKGFDLWADGYDKAVGISDEENTYPFAGYKKVLGFIFQTILESENATVLDIGFGTGTLTTKLYERGCTIYGQDFSSKMIALASEKMPNAHLYQGDFSKGLVEPLRNCRYDFIVATYSLHHLTDAQKCVFLSELRNHLKENGKLSLAMLPLKPERIWSGVGWLRGTHGMTRKSTLSLKSCEEIFRSFPLRKCPIVQEF